MTTPTDAPRSLSPDDALPPVQPPTAGFLIQLFVVPAAIVTVIVMLWLFFRWLNVETADPQHYLAKLRSSGDQRFHAAVQLAGMLEDPAREPIRFDSSFAAALGDVLVEEIARNERHADDPEAPVAMRVYLCRALQQFHVSDGLPALLKAATTQRDPAEIVVRINAVESLGRYADSIREPVVRRLLPQVAKTARALANAVPATPPSSTASASEHAQELRAAADDAERLAREARRTADFSGQCRSLSERLASAATAVESQQPSGQVHSLVADLREATAGMARHVPHLAKIQAQAGSELYHALEKAADERGPVMRFSERFKHEIDDAPTLRVAAVIALGQVGGPACLEKLRRVVENVRGVPQYNAAVGLAREGVASPAIFDVLQEMLTTPDVPLLEPKAGLSAADREQALAAGRQQLAVLALRAIESLSAANPHDDLSPLVAMLERVAAEGATADIRVEAKKVRDQLLSRPAR